MKSLWILIWLDVNVGWTKQAIRDIHSGPYSFKIYETQQLVVVKIGRLLIIKMKIIFI